MRSLLLALLGLACAGHAHARKLLMPDGVSQEKLYRQAHIFEQAGGTPSRVSKIPELSRSHFDWRADLPYPLQALAIFLLVLNPVFAFSPIGSRHAVLATPPANPGLVGINSEALANVVLSKQSSLQRVALVPCMTDQPPLRWEEARAGKMNVSALEEGCPIAEPTPKLPHLHKVEYDLLQHIQQVPGLLRFSLGVHYSLLPKVITPLLALIVWLSSLPKGATLITFVCANDCVNTAIKWAVQRPRPRWYCPIRANSLISSCGAWEVDLSFPSAHTMFFSGLAACASTLYGFPLWASLVFGLSIGLSRNYLSMHWPTDTLTGVLFGSALGVVWGIVDPYARLMAIGNPFVSFSFATSFTFALLALMIATRQAVPPVTSLERTFWFSNALCSVSPEERKSILANKKQQLRPRSVKSKVPMLATVWSALLITGWYPLLLPQAYSEPTGSIARRLLQAGVGVVGLGGVSALKKFVGDKLAPSLQRSRLGLNVKAALKALTYVTICVWTMLVSQIVGGWFLDRFGVL